MFYFIVMLSVGLASAFRKYEILRYTQDDNVAINVVNH